MNSAAPTPTFDNTAFSYSYSNTAGAEGATDDDAGATDDGGGWADDDGEDGGTDDGSGTSSTGCANYYGCGEGDCDATITKYPDLLDMGGCQYLEDMYGCDCTGCSMCTTPSPTVTTLPTTLLSTQVSRLACT